MISYPSGTVTGMFAPYAGMAVTGIHVAIGHMAGQSEPYLFMTPAEGPTPRIDVFRLVNGALEGVSRVPVGEIP